MDPSSPTVLRTFHLLKTPDILCANDSLLSVCYSSVNRTRDSFATGFRRADLEKCQASELLRRCGHRWFVRARRGLRSPSFAPLSSANRRVRRATQCEPYRDLRERGFCNIISPRSDKHNQIWKSRCTPLLMEHPTRNRQRTQSSSNRPTSQQ
jgi:hypothetical protein